MRRIVWMVLCATVLWVARSDRAGAQATANAVTSAQDAFGTSEGAESVGIYDQTSVRGFNLESAGNYRINGRYFVRNSGVSSFFLERTTVRIGYNTLSLDYPGPSGVVDYQLRDPARDEPSQFTLGWDSYEQPYAELHFKYRNAADSFSASVGASRVFEWSDEQGGSGRNVLFAGTARFTPVESTHLQVFAGEYRYDRSGRFRVALAQDTNAVPQQIRRGRYLGQPWATEEGARRIFGALADVDFADGWFAQAIGVFSEEDPESKFTQLFYDVREDSIAQSRVIASPAQRSNSYSGELRVGRTVQTGSIRHSVAMSARWRDSSSRFGGESIVETGATTLGHPPEWSPRPTFLPLAQRSTIKSISAESASRIARSSPIA